MTAHQKDEEFRQFSLSAHPLRLLITVCGPLAIYQAFQQIFTILDTIMAAHVSADAVSAIAVLAQITLMIQAVGVTMMISNIATGVCSALVVIPVIRQIRRMSEEYEKDRR